MHQRAHHNKTPECNETIDIKNKPECRHRTEAENQYF